MGFFETIRTINEGLNTVLEHKRSYDMGQEIAKIIALERTEAAKILDELVRTLTPEDFDQFEYTFIHASLGLFVPAQRIRAMELYAFMKCRETAYYGQFRGFPTREGHALL